MNIRRKGFLAGGAVAALVLTASGLAWACTGVTSPYINLSPNRALAGTEVGLTGGNWIANAPVSIVWSSSGQSLGTPMSSSAGALWTRVTIPASAAGGSYYVKAIQNADKQAATTFTVEVVGQDTTPTNSGPAGSSDLAVTGGNGGPAQTNQPSYVTGGSNVGSGGIPTPHNSTTPGPGGSSPAPNDAGQPAVATAGPAVDSAPSGAVSAPVANASAPAPVSAATPGAVAQPNPVANAANVPAVSPAAARPGTAAEPEVMAPSAVAPAPRSATADLWSGFSGGIKAHTPGLTDLSGASNSSSSPMAMAVGVLSAGLVALAGGFGIAEAKRRRVTVAHRAN